MLRIVLMSAAVAAAAAVPVAAQDTSTAAAAKPDRKICKNIVPTGSIMPKRFCLTKAEWKKLDEIHDQGSAEAFRNKRSIGCGKNGGPMAC
jgi:hypothetical protein